LKGWNVWRDAGSQSGSEPDWQAARLAMVAHQIAARGIRDRRLLEALETVPRHAFVPIAERRQSYEDRPLGIGVDQTISQPYIVAWMTDALGLTGGERVLEIGTGSGYQTAVLAALGARVYSIEILPELAARAATILGSLGVEGLNLRCGDGSHGWPEEAPFDAILVTAAPLCVPQALFDQLRPGGRLVAPEGGAETQTLVRWVRGPHGFERQALGTVRFVPMTGDALRSVGE
jgi:protein-L-isoaspartate(D-aspartate) O-methyltransferase